MNATKFIKRIYESISIGTVIRKPKKDSVVLDIKENGNIYYRIGVSNKKFVTKNELSQTYEILRKGHLSNAHLYEIVTSSKPCNATTIKWLLEHSGLAKETADGTFAKRW
ncbi:hypothetical protein [Candidatus Spongiihabitans sp.]|uniref:hypothetical protein n=1 Tax=Candidatus Spongiihabitans sp. TaxID=3101308 RepID=UPI003C6F3240